MRCPYCGQWESKVLETRLVEDGFSIRRRRECLGCQQRFTTFEKRDDLPLVVVKKDGSREPFNEHKILEGLLRACEKRPISLERLEAIAAEIERSLQDDSLRREVATAQIGEMVMEKLKEIDQVAYVRFASVYREFKDISTFIKEIETLRSRT